MKAQGALAFGEDRLPGAPEALLELCAYGDLGAVWVNNCSVKHHVRIPGLCAEALTTCAAGSCRRKRRLSEPPSCGQLCCAGAARCTAVSLLPAAVGGSPPGAEPTVPRGHRLPWARGSAGVGFNSGGGSPEKHADRVCFSSLEI